MKFINVFVGMLLLLVWGTLFAELDKEERVKVDALAKTLQLSAEQKTKVVKERIKSKKALLRLEKKWQELHDRLRREVRRSKPDQAKIDEITESIGKVRGEIVLLRTNSLIFLKSVLTPEQVKIIEAGQ